MSSLWSAFLIGIVSACSLPLGALTSRFWTPSDRTIAFLMSFGAGALLAALTLDLAGAALDRGHFYPLAAGCVTGGALFVVLNQVVNNHGGFLRKASTTVIHLRQQRRQRQQRYIEKMGRLDVLRHLPTEELQALADAAITRNVAAGMSLFHRLDPARYLYVLEEGKVELLDIGPSKSTRTFARNETFGHMALLTGLLHATTAVAREDSKVLVLSRSALSKVLDSSDQLQESIVSFLESNDIARYLVDVHGMPPEQVGQWVGEAISHVSDDGELPPEAVVAEDARFSELVDHVGRADFFADLPQAEIHEIASRVFLKHNERGHTYFYRSEPADRMYVVDAGEVALIDEDDAQRSTTRVQVRDAFGAMSFITGTRHAVTAVAQDKTSTWVLSRLDFDQLLDRCPCLAHAVQEFLRRNDVESYLKDKHRLKPNMVASWVRRAVRNMDLGKLIPPAGHSTGMIGPQHGAPMAIWLGILLDGIPESLVIGSSMLHQGVSLSLIAGLFLSNYPEALSSSVGMREQGMAFSRVLWMWTSLMLITGLGAAIGNSFFREAPDLLFSLVEGVAVGAMLTMIAETMLPEAYYKGGSVVGFSTLLGFLAALFFKTV